MPVDAIPDIGETKQIVFTEWMGRSPQDIEDQITYRHHRFVRNSGVKSMYGAHPFWGVEYPIIFDEKTGILLVTIKNLEKLTPASGLLPQDVQPALGPLMLQLLGASILVQP